MKRFRNLRKDQKTRDKYAEVKLRANDFIYPIFVVEGHHKKKSDLFEYELFNKRTSTSFMENCR